MYTGEYLIQNINLLNVFKTIDPSFFVIVIYVIDCTKAV